MFEIRKEHEEFADKVEAADKYENMKFIMTEYTDDNNGNIRGYIHAVCDREGDDELAALFVEMSDKGIDCILCGHYNCDFIIDGLPYEFVEKDD